ncbi:hypothetical protein BofuT4_P035280.1 [Botrytis cinerea T4]|uniref:Uncharacterized protein n=1 Tax=Botryotinia fuckeliana (strain T4) TaxID=999810 RepID=G2Y6I3_BOTF4|nr:hypothetical protein BofuT4_P035280.1 [Botrytis cinerea T4]
MATLIHLQLLVMCFEDKLKAHNQTIRNGKTLVNEPVHIQFLSASTSMTGLYDSTIHEDPYGFVAYQLSRVTDYILTSS